MPVTHSLGPWFKLCGIPKAFMFKNRLQEYTQKASIPLPVYQTFTEEDKRVPHFRSQVWVDGTCFASPNSYPTKKLAEQDAAKHALIGLREKVKNEGHLRLHEFLLHEDTVFCKSIVHEYASKMNMKPTYATNETEAFIPMFVSSLQLNDVTYVGQASKNKKEAEQSAARAAILSILGSESSTSMSEIVKSKFKLYDALQKVKESPIIQDGGNNEPGAVNLSTEDKKNEVVAVTGPPPAEIPQPSTLVPFPAIVQNVLPEPNTEASRELVHVFKKPKLLQAPPSPSAIAPPALSVPMVPLIDFVPPVSEQAPATGKKQNRKKRKPKNKGQLQNPTPITMIPQSSAPAAFTMAQ
ncbi:double-stranded RNA-binding protein 4 [Phtheirospermum japonicum]|uniref:Double-stranded RNA-binding protein 4 n=1 Tax=Phtheirospermum japonicum TaxID=374723 RepID=A0A830B0K3_9LAMI|nr:double-stranded RNA-binding protein 4 [Phtheirospermum japonicum]